ncbi:YadA-like family protein [Haemophilus parainfluenzae]|uniref:YadA-like family protein n=1 Tax=Haemophilus parainfluenzae TaxID=729 RepID=UPI002240394F|nr:YadA-like family protein [Haemophilus parainfluenzae]
MKHFKFNAITALIIGFSVSVANAGLNSEVGNSNTVHSTESSTAFGQGNTINSINGSNSAFGNENTVNGQDANAFGTENKITGNRSTALGAKNTVSGENATAVGYNNTVPGHHSVGIGYSTNAQGDTSVAIGWTAKATKENSNAFGAQASATATSALALGTNSKASGDSSVAVGNDSTVTGDSAVAIGASTTSTGKWSTALGDLANAEGEQSVALSKDSYAKHEKSVALGAGTITRDATSENTATVGSLTYSGFAGNTPISVVSVGAGESTTYTPPDHTVSRTVTITPHQRQIINVGAGNISAKSTDAINGSQLYAVAGTVNNVANSVKNIIGGNTSISPDGTITVNNIGGTGKNTVHEAIESIKQNSVNANVEVVAGDNIVIDKTTDATTQQKTFKVSTAKNLKADSYTVNNSNIQINQNGINAGNKKVINVANGENDNDAVNVSQLNKVKTDVANNTKNIATNTQNIANNTKAINTLNKKVHDVDRKSRAGIAGVAAIASAPSARKDGKSMVSTGVAHHRGESAIAIKASRNSDNGHWSSNVNGAADTRGQWTVGAGVGYEW